MIEAVRLFALLTHLARDLVAGHDPTKPLERLAHDLRATLDITGVGVSMFAGNVLRFVAGDGSHDIGVDRVQEQTQAGPGLDAARGAEVVAVEDLVLHAHRWPNYVEQAHRSGMRSVAAFPLRASAETLGTICLYDHEPHYWKDDDLALVAAFADLTAGYLEDAALAKGQQRVIAQLQQALESRIVIEQAKGMIAAKRSISVDDAFRILRKHARDRNASLHVVATAVVRLGLLP